MAKSLNTYNIKHRLKCKKENYTKSNKQQKNAIFSINAPCNYRLH